MYQSQQEKRSSFPSRRPIAIHDASWILIGSISLATARDNNEHLTFGGRIHFGLGATLARVEAQVIFATLAQRYPHLQLRKRR
jgi:hypothetical protein